MKLRFAVILLALIATLCVSSSAGPIPQYCKLHPKAPLCN